MNKNSKIFLAVPGIVIVVVLVVIGLMHLVHPSWVGEQSSNAGYFQKAIGLITDAPHASSELFYSSIENIIILMVSYNWAKIRIKQEHKKIDDEHGISHD